MSIVGNIDVNDFFWTNYGDVCFDTSKRDILDTFNASKISDFDLNFISLKQEIVTRVESSTGDWELHPEMASNLRGLIGTTTDVNFVINEGVRRIIWVLTYDGFLNPSEFKVYPIRVTRTSLLFVIDSTSKSSKYRVGFTYSIESNSFKYSL